MVKAQPLRPKPPTELMIAPSGRTFETYSDGERECLARLGWLFVPSEPDDEEES